MTNLHFKEALCNLSIASTENNITFTNGFINIHGLEFLAKLRLLHKGEKNGSHYLRSPLKLDIDTKCLPRANINLENQSNLIVLDCDKSINQLGETPEGAPEPLAIIEILNNLNIGFILHGTHSYYLRNGKLNRYRILLLTSKPYLREQLAPTIESITNVINRNLKKEVLFNSPENRVYAQAFFYPRIPRNSKIENLYYENPYGKTIDVCEPQLKNTNKEKKPNILIHPNFSEKMHDNSSCHISAIQAFNQQYPLSKLLSHYGYRKVYSAHDYEKWISPDSTSGQAGITLWKDSFYSHHNDSFNDGKSHDSFDLFTIREGLDKREAIIKASKMTLAPNGESVEAWNKRVWLKNKSQNKEV